MPLLQTSGNITADGYGGGAAVVPNYIEDVFSTWLYNGGTTTQTITNGIDLSTKGGMVWIKSRGGTYNHSIWDSARSNNYLVTNDTGAQTNASYVNFLSSGFTVTANDGFGYQSPYGGPYASWTFRKQPKFFDVVTFSGTGVDRQISHSLNSAPACIIIKRTDTTGNWQVWHKDVDAAGFGAMVLNSTAAAPSGNYVFRGSSFQTTTEFGVRSDATVNASGGTYVAYLFAHDAGGFGLTGTDNVISCGSYTGNGSATGPVVTLGYEPQWLMIKNSTGTGNWQMIDNMRGMPVGSADATLQANLSNAESSVDYVSPTATGFQVTSTSTEVNTNASTYIYIAIRRGPMKVPTSGTSVFAPVTITGDGSAYTGQAVTANFPIDLSLFGFRNQAYGSGYFYDRLRGFTKSTGAAGVSKALYSWSTQAEASAGDVWGGDSNTKVMTYGQTAGTTEIFWNFKRAPSFMDVVCDSGTGGAKTITHNLSVAPELWIRKRRDSTTYSDWYTYSSALGNTKYLILQTTAAQANATTDVWSLTTPTATTLYVGGDLNLSGGGAGKYVNYLFATCAGVSKVGSYTGTGTTQQINCGFTAGARFVLIKRTDSTGDWYVWDTARGIVSGNDPYLLLNSTAAEVTSTDYIDTYSAGFEISSTAPAAINASGGTFIFLAIA